MLLTRTRASELPGACPVHGAQKRWERRTVEPTSSNPACRRDTVRNAA
jgi:hypothetical protein